MATLLKVYVRHQLFLYEEAVGGGLRMVPAGMEMEGYAGKTLYVSEAVSVCEVMGRGGGGGGGFPGLHCFQLHNEWGSQVWTRHCTWSCDSCLCTMPSPIVLP